MAVDVLPVKLLFFGGGNGLSNIASLVLIARHTTYINVQLLAKIGWKGEKPHDLQAACHLLASQSISIALRKKL